MCNSRGLTSEKIADRMKQVQKKMMKMMSGLETKPCKERFWNVQSGEKEVEEGHDCSF